MSTISKKFDFQPATYYELHLTAYYKPAFALQIKSLRFTNF